MKGTVIIILVIASFVAYAAYTVWKGFKNSEKGCSCAGCDKKGSCGDFKK